MLTIVDFSGAIKYFIVGFFLITTLSILGSIASRRLNFKYVFLIAPAILIYLFLGFMISKWFKPDFTFVLCAILGLFGNAVSSIAAISFKANMNLSEIKALKSYKTAFAMAFIGGCLGIVGYYIRQIYS